MSLALRSGIFCSAIVATCAIVSWPTISLPTFAAPFSMPAAFRIRTGAGGVFSLKVNVRSLKTVISTGMMVPTCDSVAALYAFTNSMMLSPCGPSAVPTGGAGVAFPAGIWIFTMVTTCFLATTGSLLLCEAARSERLGEGVH